MSRPNHVMIDYESLQPTDLQLLAPYDQFKVTVFVGALQKRIDLALVKALQPLGTRGEYVQIEGTGPNALDFHIAYYIGRVSADDATTFFHIISSDHGFDPLIRHLKSHEIYAARCQSVSEIPLIRNGLAATPVARAELVTNNLIQRNGSRPTTRRKLISTITSMFAGIDEQGATAVMDVMLARGLLTLSGERAVYHFGE